MEDHTAPPVRDGEPAGEVGRTGLGAASSPCTTCVQSSFHRPVMTKRLLTKIGRLNSLCLDQSTSSAFLQGVKNSWSLWQISFFLSSVAWRHTQAWTRTWRGMAEQERAALGIWGRAAPSHASQPQRATLHREIYKIGTNQRTVTRKNRGRHSSLCPG